MALSCSDIIARMGFSCTPVSDEVVAVCTPISLPDNTPVYVYARSHGTLLELTDDGDTLMHLHGIGLFDHRRLASSIEKRIARFGGLLKDGAIVFQIQPEGVQEGFASFLKAIIEVIEYENQIVAIGNEPASLVDDIIANINRRNPEVRIEHDVQVMGNSGHFYRFPIKAGDTFIDTIRPNHQSTGAVLRKAADIDKAGIKPPLIVIDDRQDLIAAERESVIISSLASTMLYSTLEHGAEPLRLQAH